MPTFSLPGISVELPAVQMPMADTVDKTAWLDGQRLTVRLIDNFEALRVHTQGRAWPGREASAEQGRWLLIGDVIQTSGELANSRALPAQNPSSMVAAPYASMARLAPGTVLNIGVASNKFGGAGGGVQAEFVSGPLIRFVPMRENMWHGRAGHA